MGARCLTTGIKGPVTAWQNLAVTFVDQSTCDMFGCDWADIMHQNNPQIPSHPCSSMLDPARSIASAVSSQSSCYSQKGASHAPNISLHILQTSLVSMSSLTQPLVHPSQHQKSKHPSPISLSTAQAHSVPPVAARLPDSGYATACCSYHEHEATAQRRRCYCLLHVSATASVWTTDGGSRIIAWCCWDGTRGGV